MFSVVIPTHNRVELLKLALESVFKQTLLPLEVIVIDDGTFEKVPSSIFDAAPEELTCKLLVNNEAKGGNFSRNRGVVEASSSWIAFLDDDDEFFPEKLKEACCFIKKNEVDMVYHSSVINFVNEGIQYKSKLDNVTSLLDLKRKLVISNVIGGTSMVIASRDSLMKAGLFDEKLPALQDYDLWLRMSLLNMNIKGLPISLTLYRHETKSNSVTASFELYDRAIDIFERKYEHLYSELNGKQLILRKESIMERKIFKMYLNLDYKAVFINGLDYFMETRKIKFLVYAFLSLFGLKFLLKLRAIKGRA